MQHQALKVAYAYIATLQQNQGVSSGASAAAQ
jgi:hypothetical protein